eukprot:TRINITY_DN26540_c0_g1_i1.p1 TRINITY_DN26540_c0_g1~~TRINITY_DN26540_c0_g1_i1.p1  ORF type:complete len:606 (-),score=135.00 TRINITY_DN26540_c0_g1_i1:126-1943(-)
MDGPTIDVKLGTCLPLEFAAAKKNGIGIDLPVVPPSFGPPSISEEEEYRCRCSEGLHAAKGSIDLGLEPWSSSPSSPASAGQLLRLEQRLEAWIQQVDEALKGRRPLAFVPNGVMKESRLSTLALWRPHAHEEARTSSVASEDNGQFFKKFRATVSPNPPQLRHGLQESSLSMNGKSLHKHARAEIAADVEYVMSQKRKEASERRNSDNIQHDTRLSRMVRSKHFEEAVVFLVVLNALLVAAQVQHEAVSDTKTVWFKVGEYICGVAFAAELLLRMIVFKRRFCARGDRAWAAFDTGIVFFFFVEVVVNDVLQWNNSVGGSGGSLGRLLKMARIGRIMRVLRILRFLGELRVMTSMILNSFVSLFWLMCILFVIIFTTALLLTQGSTMYLKPDFPDEPPPEDLWNDVSKNFGSLFLTMYTLFKSMTGGVDWGEVADMLAYVGGPYAFIHVVFMFFTLFSVLNIITGVFVDGALEMSRRDHWSAMVKREKERKETALKLHELLAKMDTDKDGIISEKEFLRGMNMHDIWEALDELEINATDIMGLFAVLDQDGNGTLDIYELVDGIQKLKGDAKSFDIHMMMMQNRQMLRKLVEFCQMFQKSCSEQ